MACPSCKVEIDPTDRFCASCGHRLTEGGSQAREGERRQVTIVFCDLVGSAALSGGLDPEDWAEILHRYHTACRQTVERLEGHVAQYLGDGVLIYFGYPRAYEDAALRAVRAALNLTDAVSALAVQFRGRGIELRARVGVHSGVVVLDPVGGRGEALALGDAPSLAARVQAEATPGTVAITDAVHRLVTPFFNVTPLGARILRGFPQPIPLYRVDGETGASHRLEATDESQLTPMVGHAEDLLRLAESWRDARGGGRRTVITIGEAGIGKSRHMRSVKQLAAREGSTVLEVFCSEQQQATALSPFVSLLARRLPAVEGPGDTRDRLADLRAELSRGGPIPDEQLDAVARILSIEVPSRPAADPTPKRLRVTFAAFLHWLGSFATETPTLLVVEDLHWSDPSTLELLQQVTASLGGGMLVAVTARPDLTDTWAVPPSWEIIRLDRLSSDEQSAIVGFVTGNHHLPPEIHAQLVNRASGVPLYLEEMTKSLLESGALRLDGDVYVLDGDLTPDVVPASIQDSLMARFDRLGPTKRLLQQLAVLGPELPDKLLRAVVHTAADTLDRQLQRLIDAQMLVRDGTGPAVRYTFRHALIRDVAYQSLLRRAKEQSHREIALDLSRSFPELRASRPEFLALHFAAGGLPREAIEHWLLAGQRAISDAAFVEGIGHFNRGLALIDSLPKSPERFQFEIGLLASLGLALITTRGFAANDVAATFARAADLCDEIGDTPFRVIYGIWAVQLVRSDAEQCRRLAAHFRRIVERPGADPLERMAAHAALASWSYWQGDYALAMRHGAAAQALCDRENPRAQHDRLLREFGVDCSLYGPVVLACCQLSTGSTAEARMTIDDACRVAAVIDDPYALATVLSFAAAIHYELGDLVLAREIAERVQKIALAKEYFFWLASTSALLGRLLVLLGQLEAGFQALGEGLAILGQIGAKTSSFFYRSLMIVSLIETNRLPEAAQEVDAALTSMETALDRQAEPELLRLQAAICAAQGHFPAARAALDAALATSRARGARLFEARAAATADRLFPPLLVEAAPAAPLVERRDS